MNANTLVRIMAFPSCSFRKKTGGKMKAITVAQIAPVIENNLLKFWIKIEAMMTIRYKHIVIG